jgi:carbon-monoxide dehydrogenase large subunit/6-hydroxypseudooxynicotine dehydrogenase subunit gamma
VDGSGAVAVYAGVSSLGEGLETALAQVCAEVLGVAPWSVSVILGDTGAVPLAVGGGASRGAVMAGNAVLEASRRVRAKMLSLAAALLEAHEDDLVLDGGGVHVRGLPDRALTFRDLARAAVPGQGLPAGTEPGLTATAFFEAPRMVYPYGTHAAVVEVDPGTGRVRVLKYAIAWDVGRAINPMIVEGQLLGGLAQGLGGALLEELAYDDAGQLLTVTFMDYLPPTAEEMPEVTVARVLEEAPSPLNPLGVKGAGEGGSSGVGAAIANAVADALTPLGVRVTALPLTPDRILDALRSRRSP